MLFLLDFILRKYNLSFMYDWNNLLHELHLQIKMSKYYIYRLHLLNKIYKYQTFVL
jgi:hypothetical protein